MRGGNADTYNERDWSGHITSRSSLHRSTNFVADWNIRRWILREGDFWQRGGLRDMVLGTGSSDRVDCLSIDQFPHLRRSNNVRVRVGSDGPLLSKGRWLTVDLKKMIGTWPLLLLLQGLPIIRSYS